MNHDQSAISLRALAWILQDEKRALRFLDLTGLTPDRLRNGIGDPAVHHAVLEFLCAHEPDLIAAAEALEMTPEELAGPGRSAVS